jgi:hypothetical protein
MTTPNPYEVAGDGENPFSGMISAYQVAVDDLLDRINEGIDVLVTSAGEVTYLIPPKPGLYRLVPWNTIEMEDVEK